jgi:hypothetical protein
MLKLHANYVIAVNKFVRRLSHSSDYNMHTEQGHSQFIHHTKKKIPGSVRDLLCYRPSVTPAALFCIEVTFSTLHVMW